MRKRMQWLACLLTAGLVAACGGDGGGGSTPTEPPPAPPPVVREATLQGLVTVAGAPVAGATVRAAGLSATTAADGSYRIVVSDPAASAVVVVKSTGHLTMAKETPLARGRSFTQDFALQPVDQRVAFEAANGVVALVNGAVIDIPAGAIQDAAGAAFTGRVVLSASYRNPTTAEGIDAFPQPYLGVDTSSQVPLVSVGVIEATLTSETGAPLQLRQPATLTYPGVSSVDRGLATIPMWYYDETRGIWVREGEATRQVDGSYQAQVAHFSQWNLDIKFDNPGTIRACLQFSSGAAERHGIRVTVRAPGFVKSMGGTLQAGPLVFINAPKDVPMQLEFIDGGNHNAVTLVDVPAMTDASPEAVISPCVTLVGTAEWSQLPPPVPPTPVPADTPVFALQGPLSSDNWIYWSSDGGETGWLADLQVDASGAITGIGGFSAGEEAMGAVSGQMAVGGYFTFTGTRGTGTGYPEATYGPIRFVGRVFIDSLGIRSVRGTWSYLAPPAGVQTPPGAIFESYVLAPS